jgi:adenine deaminase
MQEQLRKGLWIMLLTKSITKENMAFVNSLKDKSRVLLVTDDVFPEKLIRGHLNSTVNLAIDNGIAPMDAISSATLRASEYLNLKDYGLIAPGYKASFFTVNSLEQIIPDMVYLKGKPVSEVVLPETKDMGKFGFETRTKEIRKGDLRLGDVDGKRQARIITMNRKNSETQLIERSVHFSKGVPNLSNTDILQVSVLSRKAKSFHSNPGFLNSPGLRKGAFASSFSHDSHNLLVLGKDHALMAKAMNKVMENRGGMVLLIHDEEYSIPLPIGGIISDSPVKEIAIMQDRCKKELQKSGFEHDNPLFFLSVLTLTVSPYYKMSDLGLVDTEKGRILDVIL